MRNTPKGGEERLLKYLHSLNPKHSHTLPKERIFKMLNLDINENNTIMVNSFINKNKLGELRIDLI